MVAIGEVLRQLYQRKLTVLVALIAVQVLGWILLRISSAVLTWLWTDIRVRRCGARKGPSFLRVVNADVRTLHRTMEEWVREFGSAFWYRMGPFHVSPRELPMECQRLKFEG